MQISSRFTMAIHALTLIDSNHDHDETSETIAGSVNTNPVVIRRIIGMLKSAGLVAVKRGTGGTHLARSASAITLLDVYQAVMGVEDDHLFRIHKTPNLNCEIGANIEDALQLTLDQAQSAMKHELETVTIADVLNRIHRKIDQG